MVLRLFWLKLNGRFERKDTKICSCFSFAVVDACLYKHLKGWQLLQCGFLVSYCTDLRLYCVLVGEEEFGARRVITVIDVLCSPLSALCSLSTFFFVLDAVFACILFLRYPFLVRITEVIELCIPYHVHTFDVSVRLSKILLVC